MRIGQLRDVYLHQDAYILGSGPSSNVFPMDFLRDKICISLNDAYKIHPAIKPIAYLHHEYYSRLGKSLTDPIHPFFKSVKYPVVKATGKTQLDHIDWDSPFFYYFKFSHDINKIWTMTKDSDTLHYTPEGCSLHGALQLCWIMGFKNIFIIGCDSTTMDGKHYANYDKNNFRDDEVLKRGVKRNYDSYVYGTIIVQKFLESKGMRVFNLSSIVGYHMVEYQYKFLNNETSLETVMDEVSKITSIPARD